MSAATFSTSWNRSCSYRLSVEPSSLRAMADSVSAQRSSSAADRWRGSGTRRDYVVRRAHAESASPSVERDLAGEAGEEGGAQGLDRVRVGDLGAAVVAQV